MHPVGPITGAARLVAVAAFAAALGGCSSVERRPGSEDVMAVSGPSRAGHCENLGETRVSTAESYWIFPRYEDEIRSDLTDLARNEAAALGGDTVAPLSPVEDGERTYGLYECIEAR